MKRHPCMHGVSLRQSGFAVVLAMFFLLVLSTLGISMFRNFSLDEKIAGNTREKQRSLQAAQDALRYGEWWLGQGTAGTGIVCNTVLLAPAMQTCNQPLANPANLPWPARIDYLPAGMTVAAGGGLAQLGGDINYSQKPSLYIQYLGLDPSGKKMLYQITGAGYGGSTSGASVVQSVYALTSRSTPLDQP